MTKKARVAQTLSSRTNLTAAQAGHVTFSARLINSRQDFHLEQAYHYNEATPRTDMFWVECKLDDNRIGYCMISPCLNHLTSFDVTNVDIKATEKAWAILVSRVTHYFMNTGEYKSQVVWTYKLATHIRTVRGASNRVVLDHNHTSDLVLQKGE